MPLRFAALLALGLLVGAAVAPTGRAQSLKLWVDGGVGISAATRGMGGSGRAGVKALLGNFVVAGRLTENSGGPSEHRSPLSGEPYRDEFTENAALAGYVFSAGEGLFLIVSGGPSVVSGQWRPGGGDVGPTLGLALEGGVYWQLTRAFGLNVVLHGNVNGEQSLGGLTGGFTLGKLR